jgi:hypothetical protein
MTGEEVRHLMALGKTVMDDLRLTGTLADLKQKYDLKIRQMMP